MCRMSFKVSAADSGRERRAGGRPVAAGPAPTVRPEPPRARREGWPPPRRGWRGTGGSDRAWMTPVVCGLGVRFLPERLSVLLAAGAVSPAAGRRGGDDCRRGNSRAGGGEEALGLRSSAAAPRRDQGCGTDARSCVHVPERHPHHCCLLPTGLFLTLKLSDQRRVELRLITRLQCPKRLLKSFI